MSARLDIALQRNEDYLKEWTLEDDDGPLDLTGRTIALQVKSKTNPGTIVASAAITMIEAAAGSFEVRLLASESSPLAGYGNPLHTAILPFDCRMTDPDGIDTVLVRGNVILSRGITE